MEKRSSISGVLLKTGSKEKLLSPSTCLISEYRRKAKRLLNVFDAHSGALISTRQKNFNFLKFFALKDGAYVYYCHFNEKYFGKEKVGYNLIIEKKNGELSYFLPYQKGALNASNIILNMNPFVKINSEVYFSNFGSKYIYSINPDGVSAKYQLSYLRKAEVMDIYGPSVEKELSQMLRSPKATVFNGYFFINDHMGNSEILLRTFSEGKLLSTIKRANAVKNYELFTNDVNDLPFPNTVNNLSNKIMEVIDVDVYLEQFSQIPINELKSQPKFYNLWKKLKEYQGHVVLMTYQFKK